MPTFISKSKYLSGLQCSKLLWHNYHAKDVFPAVDAGQQAIFDQGRVVSPSLAAGGDQGRARRSV